MTDRTDRESGGGGTNVLLKVNYLGHKKREQLAVVVGRPLHRAYRRSTGGDWIYFVTAHDRRRGRVHATTHEIFWYPNVSTA